VIDHINRWQVGVHTGKENGVHLHFLHHFDYFPTPYHSGSAVHQLSSIVLFAKASDFTARASLS
jgi:hypothetical protein